MKIIKKKIDILYHQGLGDLDIRRRRKYIPDFEEEVIRICNNFHRLNVENTASSSQSSHSDPSTSSQDESIQRLIPPDQYS